MSEEEFNDYMEDIDTIIDNYKKENEELQKEIERLHSIIKEVRETVKWAYKEDEYQGGIYTIEQILDKES